MSTSKEPEAKLLTALAPFIPGRLLAAKVFFLSTLDGVTLTVGVNCGAKTEAALAHLATVIREETDLAALPHTEHYPASFVRDQPARH